LFETELRVEVRIDVDITFSAPAANDCFPPCRDPRLISSRGSFVRSAGIVVRSAADFRFLFRNRSSKNRNPSGYSYSQWAMTMDAGVSVRVFLSAASRRDLHAARVLPHRLTIRIPAEVLIQPYRLETGKQDAKRRQAAVSRDDVLWFDIGSVITDGSTENA